MILSNALVALAIFAGLMDVTMGQANGYLRNRRNAIGERNVLERANATPTCLDPKSIATASADDGQQQGDAGIAVGQAKSETDKANFIGACDGKTITNGQQNKDGSCNPIAMGDIPAFANMVTTVITNPAPGQDITPDTDFDIKLQINNIQSGTFTNPTVTYYSAPQRLNQAGKIIGHVHVTIQDLGDSLTPSNPPDPTTFVHFKGIDDDGNGTGGLTNTVTGGLKAGFYRLCTLSSAANHQPVIMPVAQRGAQDDCTKFTVGQGNGGGAKSGGSNGNAGGANGGANAGGDANGNGDGTSSSASTTAAAAAGSAQPTNIPSGNKKGGNKSNGGDQGSQQGSQQENQQENQDQQRRGPRFTHKSHNSFKSRPYVMI